LNKVEFLSWFPLPMPPPRRTAVTSSLNNSASTQLSPLEAEVINLFLQIARILALPKSIAEIYGLLFISTNPMPMDELVRKLNLSKGSASQGLRVLKNLRAVRVVYVPQDRRDHYEAETELRLLLDGLVREKLLPEVSSSYGRLEHIEKILSALPAGQRSLLSSRIGKLRSWEKAGRELIPTLSGLLRG
jgi:DNA-binding transcriptional regulator GbsR (MarR family)